jgi:hypothetical protein
MSGMRIVSIRTPAIMAVVLLIASMAGYRPPVEAQTLRGVVLAEDSRRPIPDVLLELISTDGEALYSRQTDREGRFIFQDLPSGSFRLRAEQLGYQETVSGFVALREGEEVELELEMAIQAILLEPLTVTASPRPWYEHLKPPALWEYYERRDYLEPLGRGRFMDQEDLRPLSGMPVTMAVATLSGMQAMQSEHHGGRFHLVGRRGCDVLFFLNGMQVRLRPPFSRADTEDPDFVPGPEPLDWFIDDFVSLHDVEAIEVYRGASELPGEFHGMRGYASCGAVVVWTKRGVEPVRR